MTVNNLPPGINPESAIMIEGDDEMRQKKCAQVIAAALQKFRCQLRPVFKEVQITVVAEPSIPKVLS